MSAVLFALMLTLAGDPAAWPADPTRPVVLGDGDWIRRPDQDQLSAALPPAARTAGVGGKVLLNCMIAYDGTLEDCSVLSETPAALGLGAAALGLVGQFQLRPQVDDQSTTGGRIVVPVRFPAPG